MKNLRQVRKLAMIVLVLICASLLFLFWHKQSTSIETWDIHEVNSPLERKLLVATQSSPFKDSIVAGVLDRYQASFIIVEVIDVRALATFDAANFDAILILHRWEAGAPYESVQLFMEKSKDFKNKIVMLTTSWNGLEKMENVDAITGASIVEDVPLFTAKIIKRLDRLLKYKN